jgi:hypothetical protein
MGRPTDDTAASPQAGAAAQSGRVAVPSLRSPGLWLLLAAGAAVAVSAVATGRSDTPTPAAGVPSGTTTFAETKRDHVQGILHYDHTPPAGGPHNPVWLNCGVYDHPVTDENAVHSLEHGAVWITYLPSIPGAEVTRLRQLVEGRYAGGDRYLILSPYPGQPAPVMATAWGNQLSVQSASDGRIGAFIDHFREGPQDLEHGAPCSGGTGRPIA